MQLWQQGRQAGQNMEHYWRWNNITRFSAILLIILTAHADPHPQPPTPDPGPILHSAPGPVRLPAVLLPQADHPRYPRPLSLGSIRAQLDEPPSTQSP